jgi:hypothetical protein
MFAIKITFKLKVISYLSLRHTMHFVIIMLYTREDLAEENQYLPLGGLMFADFTVGLWTVAAGFRRKVSTITTFPHLTH